MTDDRKIRLGCVARGYNIGKGRSCSDEDPCVQCIMHEDIQENKELYEKMGEV